jgi:hypothetical protein
MVRKRRPFKDVLSLGNRKMSAGDKPGEYGVLLHWQAVPDDFNTILFLIVSQ